MVERIKNVSDPKTKKVDQELSDAELAKVAGGLKLTFSELFVD